MNFRKLLWLVAALVALVLLAFAGSIVFYYQTGGH